MTLFEQICKIAYYPKSNIPVAELSNCSPEAGPTNNAQHESAETKIIESAPSCVR